MLRVYRGTSMYNRSGRYWTTDREWARQFTQSGRDQEILVAEIDTERVFRQDPLPRATDVDEFTHAAKEAERLGYAAFWLDEGVGEPNSIYVLDRNVLVRSR